MSANQAVNDDEMKRKIRAELGRKDLPQSEYSATMRAEITTTTGHHDEELERQIEKEMSVKNDAFATDAIMSTQIKTGK